MTAELYRNLPLLKLINYCVAIHAVNAVLWHPGKQAQKLQQTNQTITIPVAAHAHLG